MMCQCGVIRDPFNRFPPGHDLQTLHHNQTCKIVESIEREIEKENRVLGICEHCEEELEEQVSSTKYAEKGRRVEEDGVFSRKDRLMTEKSLAATTVNSLPDQKWGSSIL